MKLCVRFGADLRLDPLPDIIVPTIPASNWHKDHTRMWPPEGVFVLYPLPTSNRSSQSKLLIGWKENWWIGIQFDLFNVYNLYFHIYHAFIGVWWNRFYTNNNNNYSQVIVSSTNFLDDTFYINLKYFLFPSYLQCIPSKIFPEKTNQQTKRLINMAIPLNC